jgi:sulfatase maturation enzyme AslB (radical SAM superfamily)
MTQKRSALVQVYRQEEATNSNRCGSSTHQLANVVNNFRQQPLPLSSINRLIITLSHKCNIRCTMCYQQEYTQDLDPDIYRKQLLPLYPFLKYIHVYGGEATTLKQTKEFVHLVLQHNPNVKFNMPTNGICFDDYWRTFFLQHGGFVNFSINAATQETYDIINKHGDWRKVLSNVDRVRKEKVAKKSHLKIMGSMVILEENIHEINEFIHFCGKRLLNTARFLFDITLLPKHAKVVREQLTRAKKSIRLYPQLEILGLEQFEPYYFRKKVPERHGCQAPSTTVSVDVHANVKFCCHMLYTLGNLKAENIAQIWNNKRAKEFRYKFNKGEFPYCSYHKCGRGKVIYINPQQLTSNPRTK